MRSLPGAGWWSRSLPLVSGHWARWGVFCGRVMLPLRGDDRRTSSATCKGAGYLCLCRDLGFPLVAARGVLLRAVAGLVSKRSRALPATGTSLPMELPREQAGPSHGGGVPLVSFGAPPDDRMSIAASEGESDQSGDDGSVPLPPSGRSALPDSDPEMVAMLARAAESIGLEWRPPPCPEPLRLDDWFLGVDCDGSQGPTLVPFFPEVHDELTGTWTAPFTARNRSSGSSSLASLDGGTARGYTEVPPVERSVAMQLCPRTASTWRGNPLLPSRACRHSSALTGSAYAGCGEAASALHAMALLQVHQAKALRDLHEGGHDPEVLSELRTATDLALRATKVTARSLGRAMSTMVVQECHLWLCLADMEADKAWFLNAPVSQTGLFGDAVENFAQQFSAAQKQTEAIRHILPRHAAAASTRPLLRSRRSSLQQSSRPPVQAPAKPGGKRRSKRRPRDGDDCSSGDGERTTPSPRGGLGGESFVSFFSATGLTVNGTQNLDKRAVSSISGSPQGTGGCERVNLESHSPSSLASEQLWAVREGDQSHYSRTLCRNAGKCITHADPASDRQRDARAGSLRSPSLPHRGYIGGFVGATSTVLGGLASASQPVSLAPPYHQTRLCDSVRPATSQVSRRPLYLSEGSGCPHLASRDRSPTGEGRDRAGPSSRYEVRVLQPLPKKSVGLRPILDLCVLNRALHRLPFKMLTPKRIFGCVRPQDWFAAIDLKDAYFHVSILPRHRPFLRFVFEGRAYQYKFLPFGLSLSPRVFTKVGGACAYSTTSTTGLY